MSVSSPPPRRLPLLILDALAEAVRGGGRVSHSTFARLAGEAHEIGRLHVERTLGRKLLGPPQPGDWLSVKLGKKWHQGIAVSATEVVHGVPERGVIHTPIEKFAHGQEIRLVRRCDAEWEQAVVVAQAIAMVGDPYDKLQHNCEHLASLVSTGDARSVQVEQGVTVFLGLGLVVAGLLAHDD